VHHVTVAPCHLPSALLASRAPVRVWGPLAPPTPDRPVRPRRRSEEVWPAIGLRAARTAVRATWGTRLARHATLIVVEQPELERRWRRGAAAVRSDPPVRVAAGVEPAAGLRDWYAPPGRERSDVVGTAPGRSSACGER
jgi:hypothetical protein